MMCKYPIILGLYSLLTRFISFLFICTVRFCLVSSVVTYHPAQHSVIISFSTVSL